MTSEHTNRWTRAAQNVSRRGLLWLALAAIAVSSLASAGAGATAGARLVAAWSAAATGKLKANPPGALARLPSDANRSLPAQVHGPEGDAKRIHAGAIPAALAVGSVSVATATPDRDVPAPIHAERPSTPSAFQARAPPYRV